MKNTVAKTNNSGQSAVVATNKSKNNTMSPHITSDDVKTYLFTHQFPSGPLVVGATFKIISIDLVTSEVASQRLDDEPIGLPNNELVYFVKVQGPFTTTNVRTPNGKSLPPAQFGFEVFNAETGNLLVWSIPTNG